MANQTLQKEKEKAAAKRAIPGFSANNSQIDGVTAAKESALRDGDMILYVIEDQTVKRPKKLTGYAEKINPFENKPYVRPKVVQQKIDDMKQLLKSSPIPKEFPKLKS